MNQTPNYQLNQWEADDRVQRIDFNADNAKIDAAIAAVAAKADTKADVSALAQKAEVVLGTYTGDGTTSRTISLGFTPKAVFTSSYRGHTAASSATTYYGGLALEGYPVVGTDTMVLQIVAGGFQVMNSGRTHSNSDGMVYYYVALK